MPAEACTLPKAPSAPLAVEMPGRMRENGNHNRETGKDQQETDGQGPRDDQSPKRHGERIEGQSSAPVLIVWIGFVWRSLKIAAERRPFAPAPVSTLQRLSRTSGIVCCGSR